MGYGDSYIAPDAHFISLISLFSNTLPWEKFERFFAKRKLVKVNATEQLMLLRLIALQELLCLNDDDILKWTKNQLHLFGFLQSEYKARMPTKELLVEFRENFNEVGLLKPFRKQCQRIIQEHDSRFPSILPNNTKVNDAKVDLLNMEDSSDIACPNCGSHNVVQLTPSKEASSLPSIRFSRCRFCGSMFRGVK